MSGGFFRGTTADQDTRFSNKQAKLMKSQKFAPELEHLVDMSRVKIDVVRPWIAKRVTELLGFEDEVLINFIYGLLEGKNVNGKEIQISITGFMEKNTGKFMKELWTLLLSAQKNASGVPQQFLDEKEEETKKKKADAERITNEIQKKKEREAEESGLNQKMEGGPDTSRTNAISDKLIDSHRNGREPSRSPDDRNEIIGRNGRDRKTRNSRSSHSSGSSLSPSRRSHSRSPRGYKRSLYMERDRPNRRRSISPQFTRSRSSRRSPSLSRRRPFYRRRSTSRSRSHSLSPQRFRPASRRRSPSPVRRRSPFPVRRRSPSPVRRRSPSPVRRRSPSPVRRRSPQRRSRRSPSPVRRRSPVRRSQSPPRRGSRALVRRQSHSPAQNSSPLFSPHRGSSSPSRSASPSPKQTYLSPHMRRSPSPLRYKVSPQRRRRTPSLIKHEGRDRKAPASRYRRQSQDSRKHSPSDGRPFSPDRSASESPIRQRSTSLSREKSPIHSKNLIPPSLNKSHSSPKKSKGHESPRETTYRRKDEDFSRSKKALPKESSLGSTPLISESPANRDKYPEDELRALNSSKRKDSEIRKESYSQVNQETQFAQAELEKRETYFEKGSNAKDAEHEKGAVLSQKSKIEDGSRLNKSESASKKLITSSDSGYDEGRKRKHKGSSNRHEVTSDDDSLDTDVDETKDAKRRKKEEEKISRREKRRQRHEEKRRKKEEKRSKKYKSREDDSSIVKKVHDKSDVEEEEEEKKKQLEIALRKKALESLKAKKGVSQ